MKNIKVIAAVFFLLVACKTKEYLPKPFEMKYYTKGMWLEFKLPDKTTSSGELLALNEKQAFILPLNSDVKTIEKSNIQSAVLHLSLTADHPEELRGATFIPFLTLTHGVFLILTLPINLLIAGPIVDSQRSGTYIIEYPKAVTWEELAKFSRFPQGIPKGLDIYTLKEKTAQN